MDITRLDRPDGTRQYETPAGVFDSVTTILSGTGDKSGIEAWRARVGEAEAERVRVAAAERGTRLHEEVEHRVLTGERVASPSPYYRSLEAAGLFGKIRQVHASERFVYHARAGYAGTLDFVGDIEWPSDRGGPVTTLVDWKSSDRVKERHMIGDYFLQSVAYMLAWSAMGLSPRPRRALVAIGYPDRPADFHWLRESDIRFWMGEWASRLSEWKHRRRG